MMKRNDDREKVRMEKVDKLRAKSVITNLRTTRIRASLSSNYELLNLKWKLYETIIDTLTLVLMYILGQDKITVFNFLNIYVLDTLLKLVFCL